MGLDGSAAGDPAVQWGGREAECSGLPVVVLCGHTSPVVSTTECREDAWLADEQLQEDARRRVDLAVERIGSDHPSVHVSGRVARGNVYDEVLMLADRADAVIIGGRGGRHLSHTGLLGTPLTKRSPAPVVVAPPDAAATSHGDVVVSVPPDAGAHPLLAFAFEHARRHATAVRVICCWPGRRMTYQETERWLFDNLAVWRETFPDVLLNSCVVAAHPAARLIVESEHARLLVIGSRGRRGAEWAQRRRIHRLLRWTRRPVAVVPVGPRA